MCGVKINRRDIAINLIFQVFVAHQIYTQVEYVEVDNPLTLPGDNLKAFYWAVPTFKQPSSELCCEEARAGRMRKEKFQRMVGVQYRLLSWKGNNFLIEIVFLPCKRKCRHIFKIKECKTGILLNFPYLSQSPYWYLNLYTQISSKCWKFR